jgi:hypothetical protein
MHTYDTCLIVTLLMRNVYHTSCRPVLEDTMFKTTTHTHVCIYWDNTQRMSDRVIFFVYKRWSEWTVCIFTGVRCVYVCVKSSAESCRICTDTHSIDVVVQYTCIHNGCCRSDISIHFTFHPYFIPPITCVPDLHF